jgi:hypothetical protein
MGRTRSSLCKRQRWPRKNDPSPAKGTAAGRGGFQEHSFFTRRAMPDLDLRDNLKLVGASKADLEWFDAIGWNDAEVPPAGPESAADYERREALLNATLNAETFAERGASHAGRLAAAIGARLADLRDSQEEDEEEDDAKD